MTQIAAHAVYRLSKSDVSHIASLSAGMVAGAGVLYLAGFTYLRHFYSEFGLDILLADAGILKTIVTGAQAMQ